MVLYNDFICLGAWSLTCNTSDSVKAVVDHLLANGVVTTGIVVGGILLSTDQKLRVEELTVGARADLINGGRIQIDEDRSGYMLATAGFGKEGLVGTAIEDVLCVGVRATICSETVLQEIPKSCG